MKKKLIAVALVCSLTSGQASAAGKIVFDPTNFGKNLITAAQSVKQTAQMALQYKTMVDQYMTMLTNIKQLSKDDVAIAVARGVLPADANQAVGGGGMPSAEAMEMAKGVYGNYDDIYQTMNGMGKSYDDLQQLSADMSRQSVQTGKGWEELLALELKRSHAGQTVGKTQYDSLQSTLSQLRNFQTRADRLAGTIPKNEGALQMLQTISAQNHLFSDQLSGLLQATVIQAQVSTERARSDALQQERQIKNLEEDYARREKAMNFLRSLKGQDDGR